MSDARFPAHPALPADTLRVVEIHYFRVPRERWELMVLRARQSGANGVSTYVPWIHHEPSAGALDLTGTTSPERDLVGFVQLCIDAGLGFIAKPGPFCDSEMLGGGVPTWLLEAHPEWWAIRYDGQPFRHGDSGDPRLSYAHPDAQAACGDWLRAVATVLEPFAPPDGAGLWAVQVDNETPGDGMWIHEDGSAPSPIRADFCRGDLPPPWSMPATIDELRPWVELDRLADEQMASGLGSYAAAIHDVLGDRVPRFHDWQCMPWQLSGMLIEPGVLADTCGWVGQNVYAEGVDPDHMIAGTNWYKMNEVEYVHHAWWRTRLCHTLSPAGYPHLVPEISARQAFYLQCCLIGGMDAVCVYVLHSSEPEPEGIGAFQRWAEEAPVLPDGNVLEWWWNMRCLFLCLEAGGADLAAAPLRADVAIAYDHAGERLARWSGLIPGAGFDDSSELGQLCAGSNTAASGMGVATALLGSGVEFDVVDVTRTPLADYRLVVVPATRVVSRAAIRALRELPEDRVLWCAVPTHDEHLQPIVDLNPSLQSGDPHAPAFLADRVTAAHRVDDGDATVDVSVRIGASGHRYVTVVNPSTDRSEVSVEGVALCSNPASVTWFALDSDRVVAAMLHGDEARVGPIECSQGQCAVALLPHDGGDSWHVISQERAWITIPDAAGRPMWRVTLSGKVLDAGTVPADGRFRFVHQDDRGQTDRYLLGDRTAADAAAAPVAQFFDTTLARAEAEAAALGVESWEIVERIRRTRSRVVAGSATDDELALLPRLVRVASRMNDIRLGES